MSPLSRVAIPDHPPVQVSDEEGVRLLHLGGTAVQSAMCIRAPYRLELEYTRSMMGFLLFKTHPCDIALIGLGGGSMAKFMHRFLPESRVTAVEIHPEVVAVARSSFLLPADDERLNVVIGDGAAFVRDHPNSQDVLLVDGYDANHVVDTQVAAEFYRDCHAMLRPGGVAVFNLWGSDADYPLYFRRLAAVFDAHVLQLPSETKANIAVFAFREPLPDASFAYMSGRADRLQADLGLEFDDFLVRMGYCNQCTENGFVV